MDVIINLSFTITLTGLTTTVFTHTLTHTHTGLQWDTLLMQGVANSFPTVPNVGLGLNLRPGDQ